MTQRERILGGLLGASVIGALAYQGVNTLAVQPYLKLSSDITRLRDEKAQLETNIAKRPVLQAEWATCTLHTLAPDEQVAQTRLRVSVQQLLAHAGFVGFELRKPSVVDHPLFRKAGFREVELNINKAEGGLDNLVKLLHALYECRAQRGGGASDGQAQVRDAGDDAGAAEGAGHRAAAVRPERGSGEPLAHAVHAGRIHAHRGREQCFREVRRTGDTAARA
jgi:hypothetical protein